MREGVSRGVPRGVPRDRGRLSTAASTPRSATCQAISTSSSEVPTGKPAAGNRTVSWNPHLETNKHVHNTHSHAA